MNQHPRSRYTDQDWLTMQARYAIRGKHSDIAEQVGCHISKVSQYSNGTYHIPSHRLFVISAIQKDWVFARLLAERSGAILIPFQPSLSSWSIMQLLAHTVMSFGRFLTLAEQVNDGKTLDSEKSLELEQAGADIKAGIDAIIEKNRQRRQEKDKE